VGGQRHTIQARVEAYPYTRVQGTIQNDDNNAESIICRREVDSFLDGLDTHGLLL
jgi:hypothetical protein